MFGERVEHALGEQHRKAFKFRNLNSLKPNILLVTDKKK